jgi:hypothetical protein
MQLSQLSMERKSILAIFVCHQLMAAVKVGEDKLR